MTPARPAKLGSDRLRTAQAGEAVELWVYSTFPKDDWVARKAGDATHAEHPGTAIQMGDKLYEVMMAEETAEPGYAVRYGLKPWDPHHAVRQVVPYTPQALAQAAASYLEEAHIQALRARILWFFPFAGLAPDPVQREWEKKTAVKMAWVSAGSAAMFLSLAYMLHLVTGSRLEQPQLTILIYYLAVESFGRILWIVLSGQPHGTPLLTLPYLLYKAVTRPEKRAAKKEAWVKFSYEGDEVIRRPGSGTLLVRSMLFDDILAGPRPLRFEDAVYRPLHWYLDGKGLTRRWVYELEKIEPDPMKKYREYTHPRTAERQEIVEAYTHKLDLTQSFSLLWGMYPRRQQIRLQLVYQFAAAKYTAITAGVLLVSSLLQIWLSILLHATIFALTAPVYLIFESLYRLYRSKMLGEPAGSLLGYVLQRVIRPPQ